MKAHLMLAIVCGLDSLTTEGIGSTYAKWLWIKSEM